MVSSNPALTRVRRASERASEGAQRRTVRVSLAETGASYVQCSGVSVEREGNKSKCRRRFGSLSRRKI